jgi:hypothetical protein
MYSFAPGKVFYFPIPKTVINDSVFLKVKNC